MKVIYFSERFSVHDKRFIEALYTGMNDVLFVSLYRLPNDFKPWRENQKIYSLDFLNNLEEIASKFERVIIEYSPDLIQTGPLTNCGYIAALTDFHPLIVTSWSFDVLLDYNLSSDNKHKISHSLKECDGFICDCQTIFELSRKINPSLKTSCSLIIPWGTDIDHFKPDFTFNLKKNLGWQENIVIISNRSWEPLYRIDIVLESFLHAYSNDNNIRLILIGSGSMSNKISEFVSTKGLNDVIYMPGRIPHDNLPVYYNSSDIYLSCSESDGTSVSLLEALATDLLPIVTELPSNREWVEHGVNGYLGEKNNYLHFGECILDGCKNIHKNNFYWKSRNRDIAVTRANWAENIHNLLDFYCRIARSKNKYNEENRGCCF